MKTFALHRTPGAYRRWHRAATRAGIAVMTALSAISVEAAVFGNDERTKLANDDPHELKQSIGTLLAGDTGTFCTAFCIAPDKIATASHCLFGTGKSHAPHLSRITFRLGGGLSRSNGIPLAGYNIAAVAQQVVAGTHHLDIDPPIGAVKDWAVARLAKPVCERHPLPLSRMSRPEIDDSARRGDIYQVATHADVGNGQLMHAGPCKESSDPATVSAIADRDFQAPDHILFHTCDTGGGSSGSPLLVDTPNGPEVVAINVGTYVLRHPKTTAGQPYENTDSQPIANTAIETDGITDAIGLLDETDVMTTTNEVRQLQRLLRKHRLYTGRITGRVSRSLLAAIGKFSKLTGRDYDRRLRRALLTELGSWNGIATGSISPREKPMPQP